MGIFSKPDDILTAAEIYIAENGPQEFERLISRADREARSRRVCGQLGCEDKYGRFGPCVFGLRCILYMGSNSAVYFRSRAAGRQKKISIS
ncbi:hypothetical protein L1987_16746 [Smallanthus sonchifolius]|uniref:Uncharacterized protein n=1 Tax=Smallanthus sonchifolius TaxID=185202 RepID=A0ACB9IVV1_9ASTR|nr:hypothetical protein L1987_16746 [Smallanthus sonchifolius]